MKILIPLLVALFLLPARAAPATPGLAADDLYTGVVPVDSQAPAARAAALPAALEQVLGKLSGLRTLPETEALGAALATAPDALIAFGYREAPRLQPDGSETLELLLDARFSPPAVDQLQRQLRLPRWQPERPPVVLWVVIDDGLSRSFAPVEYEYAYESAQRVAARRGQPVEWPGLDAELQDQLDLQLLWGGFTEQLIADGADNAGVLIAAARRDGPAWNVRWSYADGAIEDSWRSEALDLQAAMDEGVHTLVDRIAAERAIAPAGQGVFRTELLFTDLRGAADYSNVLGYLQALSLVDATRVLSLGPGGLRLELLLNADPGFLERSLETDGVLEPVTEGPGGWRLRRADAELVPPTSIEDAIP